MAGDRAGRSGGGPYPIVIGKVGEPWSTLPGNEGLPERIKTLIDSLDFQESNARGLADLAAGRSYSWEEFLQRRRDRGA